MNWLRLGLLVPFALAGLNACVETAAPVATAAEYQQSAKQAYDAAVEEFLAANWEYASQKMSAVQRNFAYSPYARKAQLRLADIAFNQDRYPEAISQYKAFIHDHPNDVEVAYARFRVVRAQFKTSSASVIQPPLEERDLAAVRDAHASVKAFLADYPNYGHDEELRYILESVSGMLVRHELYVARFYLQQSEFDAAVHRVQYALRNFENTGMEPEAAVLLGEVYLKQGEKQKAQAVFEHVLEAYPMSGFVVPAQRFLDFLKGGTG
jgi:outer membrane protein assembly factor BamD